MPTDISNVITIDIDQKAEKYPMRFVYDVEKKTSLMYRKKKEQPIEVKAGTLGEFLGNIGQVVICEFNPAEWNYLTNQIETLFLLKGENYISIGAEKYIEEHHTKE